MIQEARSSESRQHAALEFPLVPCGAVSATVIDRGFANFMQLARYVQSLPYGRTEDIDNPLAVLTEQRGTCSSKHQLLAWVAHECGHTEIDLAVGVYHMSEGNTRGVGAVLAAASLQSIPEAHCYLVAGDTRFDFTGLPSGLSSPFEALISEHIVSPVDLRREKARIHRRALEAWARELGMSVEEAWRIREACIAALSAREAGSTSR